MTGALIHVPFVAWVFDSVGREITRHRVMRIANGQGPDWWLRRLRFASAEDLELAACLDVDAFTYGTSEGIRSALAYIGGATRGEEPKLTLPELDRIRFRFPLFTGYAADLGLTVIRGPLERAHGTVRMVATFELRAGGGLGRPIRVARPVLPRGQRWADE